jgi:sporulation protein YlmC with PRC-barrel domain
MGVLVLYNGVAKVKNCHDWEVCKMDLPLNVKVYCVDGPCGQSKEVVLDRNTEEVTHLVVKKKDAPHTELLVPIDLVTETTPHVIRLRCARGELTELQPFLKAEVFEEKIPHYIPDPYLMPVEISETKWVTVRREAVPPGEIAVRQGARVEASDGHLGRLDEFLVDPVTEQVTHLIMREGHLWGQRDVTIPVSEIDRLEENTIYLKLNKDQVEALPSTPIALR